MSLAIINAANGKEISYNDDVRPILSDKCYFCHGPDEANNKAGLRLDKPERAYAALSESMGHAIVPGDVAESVLWQRIISEDPDEIMPPPESNLVLNETEKEILKKWIKEGAEYEAHWAFTALPKEINVPEVKAKDWPSKVIDNFVLAELEEEGLSPSPAADPLRWLRRVTFDLTGLPPQPEEIEDFKKAAGEDFAKAKESAVDRLLASKAYGENMAVPWLDASRYADSYGYQSDKLNTQWPYRDWVVKAFNENLPYDEFVTWNLAGDLLENPTHEQKLATAFNRLHRLTNEGGAIFEEWRTENVADRVHTYGTAMLGLTMECTRCHDHKYDPITMRDYYSMFAFFNSIDENGLYDTPNKVPSPTLLLPTQAQEDARERAEVTLEIAEDRYEAAVIDARLRFEEWLKLNPEIKVPDQIAGVTYDFQTDKKRVNGLKTVEATDSTLSRLLPGDEKRTSIVLDGDRGMAIGGIEPFDRWTPFSVTLAYKDMEREPIRSVIAQYSHGSDAGYNGWDLVSDNGYIESRLYRVWPGNAIGVRTKMSVPEKKWQHLTATYDGSSKAAGLKIYLDGELMETTVLRDRMVKSANVKVPLNGRFMVGHRFRDRGLKGGVVDEVVIHGRDLSALEVRGLHDPESLKKVVAERTEELFEYYCGAIDDQVREAKRRVQLRWYEFVMAEEPMHEIPVMEELSEPLPSYILARGAYDAPKTEDMRVEADTFEFISPPFPEGAPRNRLGLAQWTTDPDHPLTSRVFVNRVWASFFGAGLVTTPENFGLQGALPTHPELLDWVARDFVSNGWNVKRLCRQIALSSVYGQDSKTSPELLEKDPENRLLARGPAFRLSAEQIRDMALAASGLLNRAAGGPPVSPYQPGEDLWRESNGMSPPYKQSVGKALHRRSLYSVWKRTALLPNLMVFDAGTREVCAVSRSRTNTPLQALVLLNDVQFVEAARALAERVHAGSLSEEIHGAFLAATGRAPFDEEMEVLMNLYESELEHYEANPGEAVKLIHHGESPVDDSIPPPELAALTSVCLAVLNLDASIWKR
ncbi:DUF1553 domain-containing protein [Haloferula sp.]|uniref:DUF1553 domain-containing protein n=1 Tax=Haloferula sp. TaxID=2497595 RepID=UPI003C70CC27